MAINLTGGHKHATHKAMRHTCANMGQHRPKGIGAGSLRRQGIFNCLSLLQNRIKEITILRGIF